MGIRASVVFCVTSFLLGCLFTHWIADSLTLWKTPITDEHLWTAARYYAILIRGPAPLFYFLSSVVVLGATTILWSLRDGEAPNLMFDGGSIFLYCTTVIVYLYSVVPRLNDKFVSPHLPASSTAEFPAALRKPTIELASYHLACSVALTGVLILQASRWWAMDSERDGDGEWYIVEESEAEGGAGATSTRERSPVDAPVAGAATASGVQTGIPVS